MDISELTWRCHICGEERPDHLIGVYSRPIFYEGGIMGQENIRYCLDKPSCLDGVRQFSFLKKQDQGE